MDIVSIENAPHYHWGDADQSEPCDGWHLVQSATLSVIQERVPPGGCEVRHRHRYADQFFFVLSGIATLACGDKTHQLLPHQGLHVPAGVVHQLRNEHVSDLIFMVTSTPPSHGDKEII